MTAVSKGKGFAGVMKRHNFGGHRATHGTQKHRGPGAIGCRMDPGKVFKNKRMAGHMGDEQVTVRNLSIVKIDAEQEIVVIKGSVPGPNGGLVGIRQVRGAGENHGSYSRLRSHRVQDPRDRD